MPTLFADVTDSVALSDVLNLFDRTSHYTVEAVSNPAAYPELRGIIFAGIRYDDKCAACSCRKLELFKFGTEAYTRCTVHGLLSIGQLRRTITSRRAK